MSTQSIYGEYAQYLPKILQEITEGKFVTALESVLFVVLSMIFTRSSK